MNERDETLSERKQALSERMTEILLLQNGRAQVKTRGYIRELLLDYEKNEFDYLPGEFMTNQSNNRLSICLGVGPSPNMASRYALWFLTENEEEISFIDSDIPTEIKKNYVAVLT